MNNTTIPVDWEVHRLDKIASVERGKFSARPRNDPKYYDGDIPFLQTGDVSSSNGIVTSYCQTLNEEGLRVSRLFDKGTLLITIAANIGDVAEVSFDFACPDSLVAVVPKKNISKAWLKYFLLTKKQYFRSRATQNAQANINLETIRPIKVTTPPLPEQKAIADLLFTWDEAIEKTERLIQAKDSVKNGHIQMLIGQRCGSWPHVKTKKIFDTITEKNFPNEELLSVTQHRGVIPRTMLEGRVMSPDGTTSSYKYIKRGDFAISLRSFQGGIEYSNYQGIISPAYTVLRPKIKLNNDFYRLFFKSYIFIEKYLNLAVIGIRDGKQISIPDFLSIKIPVPPIEEQRLIAETLTIFQQEIDLLKQLAKKYKTQKRGLMQKLLTGGWRIKQEIVNQYMET